MNIAVLRRPEPVDRIRIYPGTDDLAAVYVKYLNDDERAQVGVLVDELVKDEKMDRETASRIAFGRIAVKGIEVIFDGEVEMPFTEETVDFLMVNVPEFRRVVLTASTTLQRTIEKN
jgi:hypothetical protein